MTSFPAVGCALLILGISAVVHAADAIPSAAGMTLPPPATDELPEIAPGEIRVLSVDSLKGPAKKYLGQAGNLMPTPSRTNADGISYRQSDGPPQSVDMLEFFVGMSKSTQELKNLASDPVVLPESFLSKATFVGYVLEKGPRGTNSRISRVYRVGESTLMFTEWDYLADGGGVAQFSEYINGTVGGAPSVLHVTTAESGALWHLGWATAVKAYNLYWHEPKFAEGTAGVVMQLANALSK
jgi:hypothetical protein